MARAKKTTSSRSRNPSPNTTSALDEYRAKRDFTRTREPRENADGTGPHDRPIFVVQEHHASTLHYDFRLEADGVLKSWAVPKGPSMDPSQKRLAVQVEDHPLAYAGFQGSIPEGEYGAGDVTIWDQGTYDNLLAEKAEPQTVVGGIAAGRVEFALHGTKLRGRFALVQMKGRGKDNWLLIKMKDEHARPEGEVSSPRSRSRGTTSRPPGAGKSARAQKPASSPPDEVEWTHTDKLIFPEDGITKGDVLRYYERVADRLLPFLKDRPATLERLPDGLAGPKAPHFWQKDTPASYPDWIPRVELPSERGKPVHYVLVNDRPTLLYLVNQGTVTFHVWFSRVEALDRPDFVLFDLDPGRASFADVVAVARDLHATLRGEGSPAFVKTSGKSGLHVLVPWDGGDYDAARAWARGMAERVAEQQPDRATVEIRKNKRGNRVYIDVLQNARGHHAVPPYVVRAIPGAPVSAPLKWSELTPELVPAQFALPTLFRRLARQKRDPLAGLPWGVGSGELGVES